MGPKLHKRIKVAKPGLEPWIVCLIFHTPPTEPPPTDRFTTLAVKAILIRLTAMAVLTPTYCATDYGLGLKGGDFTMLGQKLVAMAQIHHYGHVSSKNKQLCV